MKDGNNYITPIERPPYRINKTETLETLQIQPAIPTLFLGFVFMAGLAIGIVSAKLFIRKK